MLLHPLGRNYRPLLSFPALLFLGGCAITHPCQEGGDTVWNPPIVSSKKLCTQKYNKKSGKHENHGLYREWHLNGMLALEGMFDAGEKHGIWQQFDEKGKLKVEKFFNHGVESSAPVRPYSDDDSEDTPDPRSKRKSKNK